MIRRLGFFLSSLLGKKTDGTRQMDRLDDASTDAVQHHSCGLKEENLNLLFCFCSLNWREKEVNAAHLPENKWRIKEKEREKETLDRTNNVGLISLWYSLYFALRMFLFCTYMYKFASVKLYGMNAEIIHTDIAPEFTVAVAIKDEILTLTIFSNHLTCK